MEESSARKLSNIKVIPNFTGGELNTEKLLEGTQTFFDPEIWKNVSDLAKQDLAEAVKCLLVQAWTAAVMVALYT